MDAETAAQMLRGFTEKVNQLLLEREISAELEDEHVIPKVQEANLMIYPEFREAIPSMENDFFRSPFTEKERKEIIYSCPRTSSINYSPPPINKAVSENIRRPAPFFITSKRHEDFLIEGLDVMRLVLADLASTVTQARLKNIHNGLDLPGKAPQLSGQEINLRRSQKELEEKSPFDRASRMLTAASLRRRATAGREAARSFQRLSSRSPLIDVHRSLEEAFRLEVGSEHRTKGIQNSLQEPLYGRSWGSFGSAAHDSSSEKEKKSDQKGLKSFIYKSSIASCKEGNCRSMGPEPRIPLSIVYNPKKNWRSTPGLRPAEAQQICGREELQDGNIDINIHRIDNARSRIENNTLHLVIVAPKEKRAGKPIERPCQITGHNDILLCPIHTYKVYKVRIAKELCPTPHINNSTIMVNRLFRYIKNFNKSLSVDSITRYIHILSDLIVRPKNTPIPKARAIGATLAADSGVSTDDIVSHAFWSNYTIFDSYYRLSRDSSTNLTESVLNLK
ncbi:hypothetical protein BB561_005757 [Smittium simulii]|uniref:Uncharacterized protein n=1 Tax=Smittium simulii TaxID=133385 RepID=A0A2T9Y8G7_9FUNG|nr:hypothetical protein BB561_005757 [Smittium simulii]